MEIRVEARAGATALVRPVGRLDLATAATLRTSLAAALARGRRRLVVDLAGVPFLDLAGLAALVGGRRAARRAGGDLRLARPPTQPRLVLELTGLSRVLPPYASVARALAR
jgi:anti-sigma B factor antagonist